MIKYNNSPQDFCVCSKFLNLGRMDSLFREKCDSYIPNLSDKSVLDLGCGYGSSYIEYLKRTNPAKKFIHVDADQRVFARELPWIQYGSVDYEFYDWNNDLRIVGDAHEISLNENSVDLIHMNSMTLDNECVLDFPKINSELKRILKPNGFVVEQEHILIDKGLGFFQISKNTHPTVWGLKK